MLNFGHPALILGPWGRFGIPSRSVELGEPKLGGNTFAPSLVYPTRKSRIVVGFRVRVLPTTALWPRVRGIAELVVVGALRITVERRRTESCRVRETVASEHVRLAA